MKKTGFTLLEILLSLAILLIVGGTAATFFLSYQKNLSLQTEANQIINFLQQARNKAINQENNKNWGIHFSNPAAGDDFFQLYQTDSNYAGGSTTTQVSLSYEVEFSNPTSTNTKNIQFSKGAATTTPNTIVVFLDNGSKTITINSEGMISSD